ncbi:hypothetical protein KR067_003541 [Drosophila pandora]|nr:hypothetical protein KR067_003541 [Drosophila pandora]
MGGGLVLERGQVQEEMARRRGRSRSEQRRRRRRRRSKPSPAGKAKPPNSQEDCSQVWMNTYRSLVEWHRNQVLRLCPASKPEEEKEEAEEVVTSSHLDYVYESSSSEEESEPIDEEYLKFLEVTIKHQEKLRQQKEDGSVSRSFLD